MTIVLRTDRLDVREWSDSPADLARVWDMYSRWDVVRYLGATPRAMTQPAEAAELVGRWQDQYAQWGSTYGAWAIEDRERGVVAGTVLFKQLPNSDGSPPTDVEVGWHLHPDAWGHGYATEAARAVVARGFAAGVPEVYAVVYPQNTASQAVCRRLGMAELGEVDRWYGIRCLGFRLRPGD